MTVKFSDLKFRQVPIEEHSIVLLGPSPSDEAEAVEKLRELAGGGKASAQHNLGARYYNGDFVDKDPVEAARWFQLSAAQGSAEDQAILGCLFYEGIGLPKDVVRALECWEEAAEQGHALAQHNLVALCGSGDAIGKDEDWAWGWLKEAANQGLPEDLFLLAQKDLSEYESGLRLSEALEYLRSAAALGYAEAQLQLGQLLMDGRVLPQHFGEAHMWLNLAAAGGLEVAAEARDELARSMSPEWVAEAQEAAKAKQQEIDQRLER